MAALTVVRPGMLSTVQDLGRWGHQHEGVPVAGPMDWYSHRFANLVVGTDERAATLEVTLMGPELRAGRDLICAVAGAAFDVFVNDGLIALNALFHVRAGESIRFGRRQQGARAYLAVLGGFDTDVVLGSRATSLSSAMGPFGGRAVKAGDVLPVAEGKAQGHEAGRPLPLPGGGARVRVVPGPHEGHFSEAAHQSFVTDRFTITPESNRMGYRLHGPAVEHTSEADVLSDATPVGSIQVPASGLPILLMADRQTTGGYPKIATVITADLPIAGQLAPGDWIEFEPCTREQAITALQAREADLQGRSR